MLLCNAGVSRLVRTRRLLALRTRLVDSHLLPASAPHVAKDPSQPYQCDQPDTWRDLITATIMLHSLPPSRSLSSV